MNKLIIFPFILLAGSHVFSQQANPNPFPRTITVAGSAEMEVVPDEIYVLVTLREYQKRGEGKRDLESIRDAFLQQCKASGIPDTAISIASFTGYSNYYQFRKKKKDPNLMAAITYQIKFSSSQAMDALVEKLDDEATQAFTIASTGHSRMQEFRKQLKIKAVRAAKDKGIYLTDAIGEKLGQAITITEPEVPPSASQPTIRPRGQSSNIYGAVNEVENFSAAAIETDFKKIRLRFEVTIVFALQ